MTRVDTAQSEKALQVYKDVKNTIYAKYTAFGNDLITFGANLSKSTRSFYIGIGRMDRNDTFQIRVSDHKSGPMCDAEMSVNFDDLTEQLIINCIEKATGYTFDKVVNAKN